MIGTIINTIVFVIVGILFMDLVPLQENMRCSNYTNFTQCPEVYWSQDYYAARAKFRSLAQTAGADNLTSALIAGEDYTMDMAVFNGNPKKILLHMSGTHGVEGFVGSAIQLYLLTNWNHTSSDNKSDEPTRIFIHAVNPYGFANLRRFNEKNVDLNRNYLTPEQWHMVKTRAPDFAGYETFKSTLLSLNRAPNLIDRYMWLVSFVKLLARHGYLKLKQVIVTAQYHAPEGFMFGGNETQNSLIVLKELLEPYFTQAEKSVTIDAHSGLGPKGIDTFISITADDKKRAEKVWPHRNQANQDASSGPSGGYNLVMGTTRLNLFFPNVDNIDVCEEFGTVNPLFIIRAYVLEADAYKYAKGSYLHAITKDWIRDAFYPQDIAFKKSVLKYGIDAYWRANEYLKRQ